MKQVTHVGSYAIIWADQKVALIRKARGPYTGSWDFPGGKIEFGESPRSALQREVMEEVGLEVREMRALDASSVRLSYRESSGEMIDLHHIGFIFSCTVSSPAGLRSTGDDQDASEARWFTTDEVRNLSLTPFAAMHLNAN